MGDICFILEMRKCIKKGHTERDGERFITVQVKYFHSGRTTPSSSSSSAISSHCTSQKHQSHGSHSQASRCNLLKMIVSLGRKPLLLSFSFLFCLGVSTNHYPLIQARNSAAAVFLTNPTLLGKMSLSYLKCQCQNYLADGKTRAKLKRLPLHCLY